jgi:HNH endonuclease
MRAYRRHCAICALRERSLVQAAHIVPDVEPEGIAAVVNGLALCVIQRLAFDRNLLGIDPDDAVHIARRLVDVRRTDAPNRPAGLPRRGRSGSRAGRRIARTRRGSLLAASGSCVPRRKALLLSLQRLEARRVEEDASPPATGHPCRLPASSRHASTALAVGAMLSRKYSSHSSQAPWVLTRCRWSSSASRCFRRSRLT